MREMNINRSDFNHGENRDPGRDVIDEEHGDDFLSVGEVSILEHVKAQSNERFSVKSSNIMSWLNGFGLQRHFSGCVNFDSCLGKYV